MTVRLLCAAILLSTLTCSCAARLPRSFEQAASTADLQAAREDVQRWAIRMDWDWSSLVGACAGEDATGPGSADLILAIGADGALQTTYLKEESRFGACLVRGVTSFGLLPAPPIAPLFTRVTVNMKPGA